MTTQVYAPAKIILGGEHAVVYGQPAIAFPIDRGVTVSICRASEGWQPEPVLRESFDRLAELCGERVRELEFHVEGTVPAGSGLGSSAAMAVALIRGVHEFFGEPVSDKRVSELAMELETIFHGRPSGVDHTVIAKGQPIYYCRGEATILNVASPLQFVVGLTGTHAGTKQMVEGLRERVQAEPERYNAVFDDIGQIVNAMRDALEQGQAATVGQLMDANQDCLVKLGV